MTVYKLIQGQSPVGIVRDLIGRTHTENLKVIAQAWTECGKDPCEFLEHLCENHAFSEADKLHTDVYLT